MAEKIQMVDVLRAYEASTVARNLRWPVDILIEQFGVPRKVAEHACAKAHDKGLIEYGISLRSGWLTDKGRELLVASQNHG
jgi:hypothetical protein